MVTDLVEIRRLGEANAGENLRFRRFLKSHHRPDRVFHQLAREIEGQIDCKACANCCRTYAVAVTGAEIDAIARHLGMAPAEVEATCVEDEPHTGERFLRQAAGGCVFLDGNLCMVYEARPRVCREFPYVDREERSLGARMASVCRRACDCPIVYNALEAYKALTGFGPRR